MGSFVKCGSSSHLDVELSLKIFRSGYFRLLQMFVIIPTFMVILVFTQNEKTSKDSKEKGKCGNRERIHNSQQ